MFECLIVWRNSAYDEHLRSDRAVLWALREKDIPKALARHFVECYRRPPPKRRYAPLWWSLFLLSLPFVVCGCVIVVAFIHRKWLLMEYQRILWESFVGIIQFIEMCVGVLIEADTSLPLK